MPQPSTVRQERNEDEDDCKPGEGRVIGGDADGEKGQPKDQKYTDSRTSVPFHDNLSSYLNGLISAFRFGSSNKAEGSLFKVALKKDNK